MILLTLLMFVSPHCTVTSGAIPATLLVLLGCTSFTFLYVTYHVKCCISSKCYVCTYVAVKNVNDKIMNLCTEKYRPE